MSAGASAPPADAATLARWRARLDALTHWCLSELPLAPAAAAVGGRATLGDLLRRALARDGAGVVDLLDALDASHTLEARALLGRVLGGDLLLVVVTPCEGALVRADARACRSRAEADALVGAYLGRPAAEWTATAGVAVIDGTEVPALVHAIGGGQAGDTTVALVPQHTGGEPSAVLLPFLPLDGRPVATNGAPPPPAALPAPPPTVFGGSLRPGAAFLDADDAMGDAVSGVVDESDDEGADEEADEDEPETNAEHDAEQEGARDHAGQAPPEAWDHAGLDAAGLDDTPPDTWAGPPLVDAAGTLDRLRARTAAAAERVPALIATDDGGAEHVGDAAAWLAGASEQELRALARGGWTGDVALEVAFALAEDDPEADEVVQWGRRHEAELVVEIDGGAAAAWLRRHRPDTAERLDGVL